MATKETPVQPEAPAAAPAAPTAPVTVNQDDSSLGVASMILGVISLTGFGFLLGIPAIILGAKGLKKGPSSRGLSLAGLITGIVSTVLSVLFVIFFIIMMIIGANSPKVKEHHQPERGEPQMEESLFESDRT